MSNEFQDYEPLGVTQVHLRRKKDIRPLMRGPEEEFIQFEAAWTTEMFILELGDTVHSYLLDLVSCGYTKRQAGIKLGLSPRTTAECFKQIRALAPLLASRLEGDPLHEMPRAIFNLGGPRQFRNSGYQLALDIASIEQLAPASHR